MATRGRKKIRTEQYTTWQISKTLNDEIKKQKGKKSIDNFLRDIFIDKKGGVWRQTQIGEG